MSWHICAERHVCLWLDTEHNSESNVLQGFQNKSISEIHPESEGLSLSVHRERCVCLWLDPEQSRRAKGQPDHAPSTDIRASGSLHRSVVV